MPDYSHLSKLAQLIRAWILESTTQAGSGHPSSSLSPVELMTYLCFGGVLKVVSAQPKSIANDHLIFSKGHAAPLLYALAAAGGLIEPTELLTLRQQHSRLAGHPTPEFPWVEVSTGSLGQGLSIGVGMSLADQLDHRSNKTYVLLGDSEMAEGSNYEALQSAHHYQLANLVGIIDVNRLGQTGPTMAGHDLISYQRKIEAFGWQSITIDGHSWSDIERAFSYAASATQPFMIIAKTLKGRGVSSIEDQLNWHGKVLNQEQLQQAIADLGPLDRDVRGTFVPPTVDRPVVLEAAAVTDLNFPQPKDTSPRAATGVELVALGTQYPELVVLDAEVGNSTYTQTFAQFFPDRYFQMYIAEQNMVGVAMGLAARGKMPVVSSFACFLTRAADFFRVAQYSHLKMMVLGTHVGVSIGQDGPTQMGLEDIALFRAIQHSVVLYPADTTSTQKLLAAMTNHSGISYLRLTRAELAQIYPPTTEFKIGGSQVLRSSTQDRFTLVAAGVTLHQALAAHEQLQSEGILTRVIDLYSVKPLDGPTLYQAATDTSAIFVIEDHYPEGGMAEAVRSELYASPTPIYSLAVRRNPQSGKPAELLAEQELDATAIVRAVHGVL